MKLSDDLTALVVELQRARSPGEKARALARGWRTVRRLSPTERRLLVREVGFDGAEDLVEGLAGRTGDAFAPAAVLEALGKVRKDESFSLRGILAGLRDPEQREDLLERGIDLVEDSLLGREDPVEDDAEPVVHDRTPEIDEGDLTDDAEEDSREAETAAVPPPPPAAPDRRPGPKARPASRPEPRPAPSPASEPDSRPESTHEPESVSDSLPPPDEPSPWDSAWLPLAGTEPAMAAAPIGVEAGSSVETRALQKSGEGSTLGRLRSFRDDLESLRDAGIGRLREALDTLPEPWARRRALVALIEADIPEAAGSALGLIGDLDRPMDRRWCLAALARRGDLTGADLDRALEMLESPAARRRIESLSAV